MKLFLLLISYVIFPFCLPNVLFSAEQESAEPGILYSCCLACQHDPCLCSMPLDDIVTSEIPPTAHQQPIQGKRYQCTYPGCEATYKYSSSLKVHERTHTREKPYTCTWDGCGCTFAHSGHLTVHMRIHTGEKPYECPHPGCEYATTQSSRLTIHMRMHTREKPYKCPHPGCEYAATRSDVLTIHMRTHTGEKPYECNSCNGKYRRFSYLRAHLKKIHGIEIHPKQGGHPPKKTQENLDDDEAGAPEDQEAKRVHRDGAGDL